MNNKLYTVGVDLGGTKIALALVADSGRVLKKTQGSDSDSRRPVGCNAGNR